MAGQQATLPYGKGTIDVPPLGGEVKWLEPRDVPGTADYRGLIRRALDEPIGTPPFHEVIKPGDRVVVVANDITRVMNSQLLIPAMLDELNRVGVPDSNILVVVATGAHRGHTREEYEYFLGKETVARVRIHDHDCQNDPTVYVGTTPLGTKVYLNKLVMDADKIILTAEITYHQMAGYTGGPKSLLPGVAAFASITQHHRLLLEPDARAGVTKGNRFHEEIFAVGDLVKPHFVVNVVLNERNEFVRVLAGHYREAHAAGRSLVDEMYAAPIDGLADLVIASPGGYPRDINLYQSQKAMENATFAVRDGGVVIITAACPDGHGSNHYFEHVSRFSSVEEAMQSVRENFGIGPHKTYLVCKLLRKAHTILVSDIPEDQVRKMLLTPAKSLAEALDMAYTRLGPSPKTYVMPVAQITYPKLKG
ncbi:MAG: nickel-dependent lactate racemase family protein [Chloroflexota bacterium]